MKYNNILLLLLIMIFFEACSYSKLNKDIQVPQTPTSYNNGQSQPIKEAWINEFNDPQLLKLISLALDHNLELQQLSYDIKIKEAELSSSNALFWPSADLSFSQSSEGDFEGGDRTSSKSLSASASYELDLWGKLSDQKKQANQNLLQTQALYKEAKHQLIADVASAYYQIVEASQLILVYKKNLNNANSALQSITQRYKQGLNSALDVYSAKNSKNAQELKLNASYNAKQLAQYKLEQLLSTYPKGLIQSEQTLPLIDSNVKLGLPQELIVRKPTILASWNALLSKDFSLAIAHKNRFPSLSLTATVKENFESGNPVSWTLLGGITAPLFDAGLLKSKEQIALYELKKAELDYLNTIYKAFVEVENLSQTEKSLQQEYELNQHNNHNTKLSYDLALSQYLKGLIEYTQVIDSQDNYFDSQATLIQTQSQIIQNRIQLHNALGGDFKNSKDPLNEKNN